MDQSTGSWSCSICTFKNNNYLSQCEICNTPKSEKPIHSIESDHELAKRLQAQFLKADELNKSTNSSDNPFNHNESNSSPPRRRFKRMIIDDRNTSNTNSSESLMDNTSNNSLNQSSKSSRRRKRKRKREEMEVDDNDDDDNDNKKKNNNNNKYDDNYNENNRIQFRIKEECVDHRNCIFNKIGQNWIPGNSKWNNPVFTNKIKLTSSGLISDDDVSAPIESIICDYNHRINPLNGERYSDNGCIFKCDDNTNSNYPFIIIDLIDINVELTSYYLLNSHGINVRSHEWKIEGSKDLQTWSFIHGYKRSLKPDHRWHPVTKKYVRSGLMSEDREYSFDVDKNRLNGYYSKFKISLTGPNKDGTNLLRIKSLRFHGKVRRKAYKLKERTDEMKTAIFFPKIASKRCCGDPNKILKILNEWNGIQHNECKQYEENIADLKVELKDYQKRGLSWMINMENNGNNDGIHGGLLCDEMGLGKTVQIIALMLVQREKKRRINDDAKDRTIIITPLSLIDQWISELVKIADKKAFKIINFYGSERKRIKKSDFEECDVVLSTVDTFSNIIGKISNEWDDFEGKWWKKGTKQQLLFKLPHSFFSRIVIDESHEIKNTTSKRSETICAFAAKCDNKWCLTGTPINNDICSDLSGMCKYLGIKHETFVKSLKLSEDERNEANIIKKSKFDKYKTLWLDLDNEFCIKKIKTFLKPIMLRRTKQNVLNDDFPDKEEEIIKINLNNEEKVIYNKISKDAWIQYKEFKRTKSVMAHYMHLMRMLTKLRKLCDHPSMIFNKIDINSINNNNNDNIMDFGVNTDVLDKLHNDIIRRINEMDSLFEYECPICFELTELNGGILSKCGHMFCIECLDELILDKPECGLCRGPFTKSNIIRTTNILKSNKLDEKHKEEFEEFKINGSNNRDNDDVNEGQYDEFVQKYSEITCSSSKINALIKKLKNIKENYIGDKVIVFSNFTNFLGIIANKLENEKIKYLQFHSGLNRKKRKEVLSSFKSSTDCLVLLISSKCASVGLNIMCANHVILLDPRFNAGLDNQAIGRCHRIGQKKTVFVTRFIIEGSIEEKILSLQQDKKDKSENNTNLKRKAKLIEKDYDILFDYKHQNDNQ